MLEVVLWVGLGVLLLLSAGALLFVLGRSVYRKAALLLQELSAASQQFSRVSEQLQVLAERSAQPAVFDSPSRLRQQRHLDRSGRGGRTMTRKPPA